MAMVLEVLSAGRFLSDGSPKVAEGGATAIDSNGRPQASLIDCEVLVRCLECDRLRKQPSTSKAIGVA